MMHFQTANNIAMTTKPHTFLPFISGLFVATLLISVSIAGKLIVLGPLTISASVLLFPLAFLFSDLLTEVYGYAAARQVIWTGFVAELLLAACYSLAVALPWPDFFHNQEAYATVLSQAPRIVVASVTAYLTGEFFNSLYIASTMVGQAADSLVFYPIAFAGVIPLSQLPGLIASTWLVKVLGRSSLFQFRFR